MKNRENAFTAAEHIFLAAAERTNASHNAQMRRGIDAMGRNGAVSGIATMLFSPFIYMAGVAGSFGIPAVIQRPLSPRARFSEGE